jgi:glycerol-3-phosphate dehydrogenase (NAD(P)+)
MSQIVEEEVQRPVVALTGPSHAEELAVGMPTGCVAACQNQEYAELVQDAFMSECFRIYTNPDIIGAELGGALKNVIALC